MLDEIHHFGVTRPLSIRMDCVAPSAEGQVRRNFDPERLATLAASLKRSGVREPILVTADPVKRGHYRIVAGERRWRAAQLAGLAEIPCIIDEGLTDPKQRLLAQAEENLHREDLNAVEEATVLVQLMDAFGIDAQGAGALIGRSYQQARRLIQIHDAPQPIRDAAAQGYIDARAALELVRIHNRLAQGVGPGARQRSVNELDELIDRVVNEHWSIRRLEKYARELEGGRVRRRERRPPSPATDGTRPRGVAVAPVAEPPYRLDGTELVLDTDRIARRLVSPEEREELIEILEQVLTMVRRAV